MGGATEALSESGFGAGISIHAPRGGSDKDGNENVFWLMISIHAPRGGSDQAITTIHFIIGQFLSTLPVGGATANMIIFHSYLQQFIMQSDNFF